MAVADRLPNVAEVRQAIPQEARERSTLAAAPAILASVGLYLASWFALLVAPWWLWLPLLILTSLGVGLMFITAHDAAHNSLTSSVTLNGILARILFLPAWHSLAGWVHAHNHIHHGWTNFQPRDYVWAPMSWDEYNRLSSLGKLLVRVNRSWPGLGVYYAYEILFKRILVIQPETKRLKARLIWLVDDLIVLAGVAGQTYVAITISKYFAVPTPGWLIFAVSLFAPCLLNAWLVGFITYLQHTHPAVPWFQDLREWNFYTGQVLGTTHTEFSGKVNDYLFNIMEHTAHHADPRIPLYHLALAQFRLGEVHHSVVHRFSWKSFRYALRVCQLYDFQRHCWLDFQGRPTSSRTIALEQLQRALRSNSLESES